MERLANETLLEIVGHLSDPSDLARCARVNRAIGACALSVLYRDINLSEYVPFFLKDAEHMMETTLGRQRGMMDTIAWKPSIAKHVRSFRNATCTDAYDLEILDVTMTNTKDGVLLMAAKNMWMLNKAEFGDSPIANFILRNMKMYPCLKDLALVDLKPTTIMHAWDKFTLDLTKLSWKVPYDPWKHLWEPAGQILVTAMKACPNLISLDIWYFDGDGTHSTTAEMMNEVQREYADSFEKVPTFQSLQHFGFIQNIDFTTAIPQDDTVESNIQDFLTRHKGSLTSWKYYPGGVDAPENVEKILRGCKALPQLTSLTLSTAFELWDSRPLSRMSPWEGLQILICGIAESSPLLERFMMSDIECPFLPMVGQLFGVCQNLRFLRLGDCENFMGQFDTNGSIDFESYNLLAFIEGLPPLLEELYLKVRADGLALKIEHFDPVVRIGPQIFKDLRRLHTCDIIAHVLLFDDILTHCPEHAVHWRRLPHEPRAGERPSPMGKVKILSQSRSHCTQQRPYPAVSHEKKVMRLESDEGAFEGKDAREAWLGGNPCLNPYAGDYDKAWSRRGDPVRTYPMYEPF